MRIGGATTIRDKASTLRLSLVIYKIRPKSVIVIPALAFVTTIGPIHCRFTRPIFVSYSSDLYVSPRGLHHFYRGRYIARSKRLGRGTAKGAMGTVMIIRIFKGVTSVRTVVSVTRRFRLGIVRSTARTLNARCAGKHCTKGFTKAVNSFKTCSFGKGGVVAANNNNTIATGSPARIRRLGCLSARTGSSPRFCVRGRIKCGCHVAGLRTTLNITRVRRLPRFVRHGRGGCKLCRRLLRRFSNKALLSFHRKASSGR